MVRSLGCNAKDMNDSPQFPHYPNNAELPGPESPVPHGIPFVDNKYHKPLYKMMKMMMTKGLKARKSPFKMPRHRPRKKVKVV